MKLPMKQKAEKHLALVDPVMGQLITKIKLTERKAKSQARHFETLVESIVSQQLSVKASDTIFARFKKLFLLSSRAKGRARFPKPEQILKMSDLKLRSAGLSNSKVKYIKDLAKKVHQKEVLLGKLKDMSDEEVIEHLIQVKGIGRWTGEMFLMFSLARPDVFSHGDFGLRNAIQKLYGRKRPLTQKQIEKIVAKWSPHRTLASRYLWKSLDNE